MINKHCLDQNTCESRAVHTQTIKNADTQQEVDSNLMSSFVTKVTKKEPDLKHTFEVNNSLAIVKFKCDNEHFATVFKSSNTIDYIKECLGDVLEIQSDEFALKMNGNKIEESLTLSDFGAKQGDKIEFHIVSLKGSQGKRAILAKILDNIPTLDVITVHLGEAGDNKDIVVEIENQCACKEWLGGYRNTLTGVVYHHAVTQTAPNKRKVITVSESGEIKYLLNHRSTQTPFKPKDLAMDTHTNKSTQMWRLDLFIPSKTDKIVTPGKFISYDDWYANNNNLDAIITIQRAIRRWLYGKNFKKIIELQKNLMKELHKQKLEILQEQANKEREIIIGAACPVKRDDFYMLYLMVGSWWKREWKRICNLRTDASKKAESVALLQKEIQLLKIIEKHRVEGKKEALNKRKLRFLHETSRPMMITNAKGHMVAIEDKNTERARDFKEIYSALISKSICPKDRIELLLTFRDLFSVHYMNFEYANDLISLVNREIDLLTIGTKLTDLEGLHKRIEQLFMHFLHLEEFNPKAASYKEPNCPKTVHNLFRCSRCNKDMLPSKYPAHVRMLSYSICKSCSWLTNIGHKRVDMSPFLKLLKQVQNSEMEKCCYTAVCFILQSIGMSFLTNVIWHGHSAISECSDLSKLKHIRWISDVEWAPWNTIFLTDQEAKCHSSIKNVFQFYDPTFIEKVRQKHILARIHLQELLIMDNDIRSSGVWANVKDSGLYQHRSHMEEMVADESNEIL